MSVYFPEEDSFFLAETIKKSLHKKSLQKQNKNIKVLDLGCGSGIQAENLLNLKIPKKNILALDIDKEAVETARKKGFNAVKSDLFQKIRGRFDLIIFNPPYLPENRYDKEKDTTGGKHGDETILKFLQEVKKHLSLQGKIFLLLSSLTPRSRAEKEIKKQKLKKRVIATKNLFFETLEIWLICL